jgi:hypothetical protein
MKSEGKKNLQGKNMLKYKVIVVHVAPTNKMGFPME